MIYKAKVVEQLPEEDCVQVIFMNGSTNIYKVKMLRSRANPLYGEFGNLPDIGEEGLVLQFSEAEYFWLGSYHNFVENICSKEFGSVLVHWDNDLWCKTNKDSEVEFSHPSGSYFKIGYSTQLSERERQIRKPAKKTLKQLVTYALRKVLPVKIYMKHNWIVGSYSETTCPYDNRKKTYSYSEKTTEVTLQENGNINFTHNTVSGSALTVDIDPNGNVVIYVPANVTVTVTGNVSEVIGVNRTTQVGGNVTHTVGGNITEQCSQESITTGQFQVNSAIINLGGDRGGLRRFIDERLIEIFNNHTHSGVTPGGGNSGTPNQQLSFGNTCTDTVRGV